MDYTDEHGTRPLPNKAFAHLDDTEKESASSHQPKATETQGHETVISVQSVPKNKWMKRERIRVIASAEGYRNTRT